jgi:hypothetical protein
MNEVRGTETRQTHTTHKLKQSYFCMYVCMYHAPAQFGVKRNKTAGVCRSNQGEIWIKR